MLSQLTKTVKLALKSTEEERAILRARSAIQRFPVVEWRQRTEDFHKRSITASRALAGVNAWREIDCNDEGVRPMADTDDWDPIISQTNLSQPEWDNSQISTPSMAGQWSQDTLTNNSPRFLHPDGPRNSFASSDNGDADFFASQPGVESGQTYVDFLEKANRTIARDQRHAPDPFIDGLGLTPNRPFGEHSRVSSVESISSIVDEKSNSPLNKAIASVSLRHLQFLAPI